MRPLGTLDMTTNAFDTDSMRSVARNGASRSGLRLVVGGTSDVQQPAEPVCDAAVPCIALKSAVEEKGGVVLGVLTNLFKRLLPGERIEFVHQINRGVSDNRMLFQPYRLTIKVACSREKVASLKQQVAEAILTAYPGLHFETCPEQPDGPHEGGVPHVVQFALAGAVVTANPAVAKFDRQEWQQSTDSCPPKDKVREENRQVWPFPDKLANWALTAPLYEQMDLPEFLEVNIRVHGFSLNAESCEALHKTMLRVLAGNLDVFHPESPIAAYSASADLKEAAVALVRHWLRHPTGFAVDCVLRSSSPLGEVAQQRIAADVFGNRPFARVRSFDESAPLRLEQPTLAWANTPDQGIPALMPGQLQLHSLAIPRHYPVPAVTPPQTGAWLGTTVCGHRSSAVKLPAESRSRHVALFGGSGAGKSALLAQMIAEDISDPHRSCGVGLIDPHGDLYERVLAMISPERAKDVVLINTRDLARSACLNPLQGIKDDPVYAQFVVGEVMSLIDMLFETKDSSGPMTRNILRNLLLLSACMPGRHGTFLDAARILEDRDYLDYLLSKCKDRSVVDFWEQFKKTTGSDNGFVQWLPYLLSRLGPFTASPTMKRLINRPESTIDPAGAMRDRKIVLFNLSKSVLQDTECQVLGSLILMKFFGAALGRARLPEDQRAPFHLYVDEFQTFATDSVPRMFSEARKFNLCLTTANQSISQLNNRWGRSDISASILANTATKFFFRLGPSDAETLRPYFRPQFDDAAMSNLPDFHAVACMSDQNRPLPPFVLRTNLAVSDPELHVPVAELVAASERYTTSIASANKELVKLYNLSEESLGIPEQAIDPVQMAEAEHETIKEPLFRKLMSGQA